MVGVSDSAHSSPPSMVAPNQILGLGNFCLLPLAWLQRGNHAISHGGGWSFCGKVGGSQTQGFTAARLDPYVGVQSGVGDAF